MATTVAVTISTNGDRVSGSYLFAAPNDTHGLGGGFDVNATDVAGYVKTDSLQTRKDAIGVFLLSLNLVPADYVVE